MRPIDADKLLTELMDSDLDHLQRDDWKEVIQIVQDAPTVPQWIPVTDIESIEKNKYFLVTTTWGQVTQGKYTGTYWEMNGAYYSNKAVIAWMELPEPYDGGGE